MLGIRSSGREDSLGLVGAPHTRHKRTELPLRGEAIDGIVYLVGLIRLLSTFAVNLDTTRTCGGRRKLLLHLGLKSAHKCNVCTHL